MSYGPGYTMWKQILREREERRLARQQAKRTITPPQEPEAPARKRSKNPAGAAAETVQVPTRRRAARRGALRRPGAWTPRPRLQGGAPPKRRALAAGIVGPLSELADFLVPAGRAQGTLGEADLSTRSRAARPPCCRRS